MISRSPQSRQRATADKATGENAGNGPSKRGRGSIAPGLLAIAILVIAMVLLVSGCSAVEDAMKARMMDDVDGICAEFQVLATDESAITPDLLEQTRVVTENRVNATGIADPVVLSRGPDRIEVALPGINPGGPEADLVLGLIGTTGVLEFVPVPDVLASEWLQGDRLPDEMADVEPLFDGSGVANARIGQDVTTGEIVVEVELGETAARIFDDHAAEHVGERFAIVLDDVVESAASINATRFDGRAQISGDLTVEEAANLVTVLRFGSLPLEVSEIGVRACGAPEPAGFAATVA